MLRSRNWGLKYVGVQDRALKLFPDRYLQQQLPESAEDGKDTSESRTMLPAP